MGFAPQNTGLTMLLKAMGLDPQQLIAELQAKAIEAEQAARTFAGNVQGQVTALNERMGRIEALLLHINAKLESAAGQTLPAGECSIELHEPAISPQKEYEHNGRNTGDPGKTRRIRATG